MLTKKQLDLLELIQRRIDRDGIPPSFDEMKDELDLRSKSGIHRLITALEDRGFIRRLAHRARAIEIVKLPDALHAKIYSSNVRPLPPRPVSQSYEPANSVALPVMGRIAAGVPITAISEVSHNVAVPASMVGQGEHYALEVKGDSMIDAGINDEDVVVIRQSSSAENGQIVVALIEDEEATLKRYRRQGSTIMLEAANPAYETRLYDESQVKVQGQLVGLIRTYR